MTTLERLTLAALLHDIGKFSQLAGFELDDKDRDKIQLICPDHREKSNHFHAIHSAAFLKKYFEDDLADLVMYHHVPEKLNSELQSEVKILALADWLANGELRDKEFEMPEWAAFVKTSTSKLRPPAEEWWHLRAASILRQIYLKGLLGVEKLRTKYGSKKDRGAKKSKFFRLFQPNYC